MVFFDPGTPVDDDLDVFGAEPAAARLIERLARVPSAPVRSTADGRARLTPGFALNHDRVEGSPFAPVTLVAFGAHATPASRPLGRLIDGVREQFADSVCVAWRHYPDPVAHPRAAIYALAAEAAFQKGRFWALTRELLALAHHDPPDLHAAVVRAGLDPGDTLAAMRVGTGTDRIAEDVASAQASGVMFSPTLFINGDRYEGELDPASVRTALEAALP